MAAPILPTAVRLLLLTGTIRYPRLPTIRDPTRDVPLGPMCSIILHAPALVTQPLTLLRPLTSRDACLVSVLLPLPSRMASALIRLLSVTPLICSLPRISVPELTIPLVVGGPLLNVLLIDPLTPVVPLLSTLSLVRSPAIILPLSRKILLLLLRALVHLLTTLSKPRRRLKSILLARLLLVLSMP